MTDDDLTRIEQWLAEGGHERSAFIPVDAAFLANAMTHMIREVRAARAAARASQTPPEAAATPPQRCSYPDCDCPFDAPADPAWCARGLLPRLAAGRDATAQVAPAAPDRIAEAMRLHQVSIYRNIEAGERPTQANIDAFYASRADLEAHLLAAVWHEAAPQAATHALTDDDATLLKREVDSCLYGHLNVDKHLLKRLLDAIAAREPAQAPAPGFQWVQATPAEWVALQDARTAGSVDAAVLATVRQAVREYHQALDRRAHGGVAQDAAMHKIEAALGQPWVQGATLQAPQEGSQVR
jgi:hypothetical protein